MTACYEISQIRFSYDMGRRACLAIDNFQIGSGEFVALLGPNGSGKTTLLHVLAFLNIPQQGFIRFNGEILTKKMRWPFVGAWACFCKILICLTRRCWKMS
jgi:tungstate transport system ATP-binding protein